MDKEIIDKVMFDNFLRSVPTMVVGAKDRKTISAYGSIDVNDLRSVIDTFKKVPEYGELLKQNKKQKEVIDKAIEYIKGHKYTIKHYEPYGTPTGLPNYETYNIEGYYQLLDILNEVSE